MSHHDHDDLHDHDRGLSHDLPLLVERGRAGRGALARRGVLALVGGLGAAGLVACAGQDDGTTTISIDADQAAGRAGGAPPAGDGGDTGVSVGDGEIPEETAGPYPADGSNGVDVLSQSGVVRSDITSSFGTASGVAAGVPLTIRLKVYDLNGEEATALTGAAVYLWHCNRDGEYSMYSEAVADENYLRGVQEAADDGTLSFTSIFPAAYDGRWPHIHFEVYPSLADATAASNKLRTSQIALPEAACDEVYATAGYEASVANLARTSLESDMVFGDGHSLQLATVTGSVDEGYVASLNVPV